MTMTTKSLPEVLADLREKIGEPFRAPPATYIVGRDGAIVDAYLTPEFRERLDPRDIVRHLGHMGGKP